MNINGGWTQDRIDLAVSLKRQGLSASRIAARLGSGITRNSVIGRLSRMRASAGDEAWGEMVGAPGPQEPTRQASTPRPKPPSPQRPLPPAPPPAPVAPLPAERYPSLGEALIALPRCRCRWPMDIDDPAEVRFCGAPATHGVHKRDFAPTYCASHHQRSTGAGSAAERAALRRLPPATGATP